MPPISGDLPLQFPRPRPIGRFVVTIEDVPDNPVYQPRWWVEKITSHTEHGAEVRSRWCEAFSYRKAYLIASALNNVPYVTEEDLRGEALMTQGER